MNVPFHRPYITEDEVVAASERIRAGWLTMGGATREFEDRFCGYLGCPHAVAVNSATAALHLALIAAGIGEGDEVIVPAMTFAATAETVRYVRARPVLADVEPDTMLVSVASLESKITPRTRAVMPVHYAGQPCDMDAIMAIARDRGLAVIEDAAHSLPARIGGRSVGTIGDATCFSFYATKTITTGEGGMLCTARDDWAARARRLRLHGISRDAWERQQSNVNSWEYDIVEVGYKYNMTDIAAAIGIEQLKKVDLMHRLRSSIAARYDRAFAGRDDLAPYPVRPGRESAWYLYPLTIKPDALTVGRDRIVAELRVRGVGTSVHFIPLYRFTCYRDGAHAADFPGCELAFSRVLSLPIFPGMADDQVDYVIEQVIGTARQFRR